MNHAYTGMDVSWRPVVRNAKGFSHHRKDAHGALRSDCTQYTTILWNSVPPRGYSFSDGQGLDRAICPEYLWMQAKLDHGLDMKYPCVYHTDGIYRRSLSERR